MGALADVGNTEAEAGRATKRVVGLQVEETWTAKVAVGAHHVDLETHKGSGVRVHRSDISQKEETCPGLTLQVHVLQGSLLVLPASRHWQGEQRGKPEKPKAQRSQRRPLKPRLHSH